jgi:hypothetical protein
MATGNNYLRSADSTKAYRVGWSNAAGKTTITGCFCTGNGVTLPGGDVVAAVDVPVKTEDVLIDFALSAVVASTVAEYRAVAATVETALATAIVAGYASQWS